MTLREVLNRVLRATGGEQIPCETTVIERSDHLVILEYLNQFKEEIEGSHQWRALKQTWQATVPAGAGFGFFGSDDAFLSNKARLYRVQTDGVAFPLVYDKTDASNPYPMRELDLSVIYHKLSMATSGSSVSQPAEFSIDITAEKTFVRIYPGNTSDRTIQGTFIVPQNYLDVSDLDTIINIPTRALIIGTIWYVLEERGEELGQSSLFTEERYIKALDQEIASDLAEQGDLELVRV